MINHDKQPIKVLKDVRIGTFINELRDVVVGSVNVSKLKFLKYNYDDLLTSNQEFHGVYVKIPETVNYATISHHAESDGKFDFTFHVNGKYSQYSLDETSDISMQRQTCRRLNEIGGTALTETSDLLQDTFPNFGRVACNHTVFTKIREFANLYDSKRDQNIVRSNRNLGNAKSTLRQTKEFDEKQNVQLEL